MKRFTVQMKSLTPILFHHNNILARDALREGGRTGGRAGDDRTPADTWKSYLYVSGGQVVMPSDNVQAALAKVGGKISIGGKKTLKQSSQMLFWDSPDLRFQYAETRRLSADDLAGIEGEFDAHAKAATKLGFELFVKPCRVGTSSHVRVRPRFNAWSVSGVFEVDDEELTHERLQKLFTMAGAIAGLGDWRPSSPKPGPFGRFTAEVIATK